MDLSVLEKIGLTGNEAKVYVTLLELGSVSAGPLIKRMGMHRAAVYDLLDLLIDKGLVSYVIKANRKYFEAQEPERLLDFVREKKEELNSKEEEVKKLIPDLTLKRAMFFEKQEGSIYKGKKGLRSIFEDVLAVKKPFFVFGASGKFKEIFHAYFIHFHKARAKLRIPMKIIFGESLRKEKREKELKLAEIRYLPKEFITPSTTYVYGDKIVVILWSNEPMAFLMKSKEVADSYRTFFGILWEKGRK